MILLLEVWSSVTSQHAFHFCNIMNFTYFLFISDR